MTIRRKTGEGSVIYPESDGKPMADNTLQFRYIAMLKAGFDDLYLDREDVFVAGDLLWYPVEGDNKTRYAPDVLIAIGRTKGDRGSYLQWLENHQPPDVVYEVLSPGNTKAEMKKKLAAYEKYGVQEYYEYDPDRGVLKGWLRVAERDRLAPVEDMQHWQSPITKVTMHLEEGKLIVTQPDGSVFLDSEETAREMRSLTAEKDRLKAEKDRLAELLKEHGIDPDE